MVLYLYSIKDSILTEKCIKFIEYRENKKLVDFLKINYNRIEIDKLYDVAFKNNNMEAFNILFDCDIEGEYLRRKLEYFNPKQLKVLFNKGFIPNTKFINVIINEKGNEGATLLKLLFQHLNFSKNNFILHFLINYYWNKNPLSKKELNTIINNENKKLSITLESSYINMPLFMACYKKYDSIVKVLIENGANVNVTKKNIFDHTETPLSVACGNGNESIVKYLVERGAYINVELNTYDSIKTPLSIACENGKESIIKYLVEHGANINVKLKSNDSIKTPLSIACENGNESIVKYLIENGANINVELKRYSNIKSIKCKKGDEPIIDYLICHGANTTVELIRYDYNTLPLRISPSNNSTVQYLIANGAVIKTELNKYYYDNTPLSMACVNGDISIVKYLVEHGADVNAECKGPNGSIKTPLIIACENEKDTIARYLIEHGANVNVELITHNSFNTPLSIACDKENESMVKYLIEHGANANIKCKKAHKQLKHL